MGFLTDVDIGNRACQHMGVPRLDPSLGFAEVSQRAQEISSAYGKIKQAELRRNVWQFAIRSACLRPIDINTMLLAPAMWQSGNAYFKGSVVSDENNFLWQSKIQSNIGLQPGTPGNVFAWEPYFGPLTAGLYVSSTSYNIGEVVYTAPGDGSYNVYLSLVSGNTLDPSLPNQWSATTTYFQGQVVQQYPAWSNLGTYGQGTGALYTDGNVYVSLIAGNTGHTPPSSPAQWALMPTLTLASPPASAPTTSPIIEWSSTTVYSIGSFVLFNGSTYLSLVNNNTGNLPSSVSWTIVIGGTLYRSAIDLNFGNNPGTAPGAWLSGTTYATGNSAVGSDGVIYQSLINGNIGNNPVTDGGVHWSSNGVFSPWTPVTQFIGTQGGGNQQWLQIGGAAAPGGVALKQVDIVYPLGAGPAIQTNTKNVYRLPANWLREAPQDPKAGSSSWLGAPSGLPYNDWEYRGNYFVTRDSEPIIYWFAADVVDVSQFDPMFCETLGYHIALGVVEVLTQSSTKKQIIAREFEKFGSEARIVNGIGVGATEPPEDDYVTCRL